MPQKKGCWLRARVTPAEHAAALRAASDIGLSVEGFLRSMIRYWWRLTPEERELMIFGMTDDRLIAAVRRRGLEGRILGAVAPVPPAPAAEPATPPARGQSRKTGAG